MTNRYLTIADVMDRLNIGKSTVYRRIADGTLPAPIKIGRLTRFSERDLVDALAELEEPNPGIANI